jgi:phage baseplate assembly protein W
VSDASTNSAPKGFAFPFAIDPATGGVRASSGDDKLRANIAHIVLTNVGERMMRRGYGGGLRQLLQDPDDQILWTLAQHQIGKTVAQLEPRVMLQQVSVSRGDDASVVVEVVYVVRRTQTVRSLSIPVAFVGYGP